MLRRGATPQGAPIWISGSYDPELGLLYYGTGQPNPQWTGQGREGDNLYSDSIVALDVKTGAALTMPATKPTNSHEVKIEGDRVFVRLRDE